ncbi:hypothetical protein HK097_002168 [Rhizophlyctis rosea]|uniref:Uncharacterized protein n=1 Tax=Rhizophlyctis rosea TaxID=64517 RepID=A0AAD5SGP8_9FUNG|nr:hypothetical protein HK097_002168 [Rhizophlyctis rosea]
MAVVTPPSVRSSFEFSFDQPLATKASPTTTKRKATDVADLRIFMAQLVFLVTGLISTLGAQWLHYRGAAESRSMLPVLATYLGMAAVALLPSDKHSRSYKPDPNEPKRGYLTIFGVSTLDVLGNVILMVGMFYVGSGLYQVIYSSVIVFTALLSKCFLRRTMSWAQWAAIFAITGGLSLTALERPERNTKRSEDHTPHPETQPIGFILTILGTAIYAIVYILNDHILSTNPTTFPPRKLCVQVGSTSTLLTTLIMLLVSLDTVLAMPLTDSSVIFGYVILILSALFHNLTYFELLEGTGAVATGVLQALRAVMVFGLSHVMFCESDSMQCFTPMKGVATVVVVCGVVGFSVAKASAGKGKAGFEKVKGDLDEEDAIGMRKI